jgi:ribonuclease T
MVLNSFVSTPPPSFSSEIPTYVSVDIETSGPHPRQHSILSIGACLVARPNVTFYVELKPVNDQYTPEALSISGLSMNRLLEEGITPVEAMQRFEKWLAQNIPSDVRPIFVAFNAAFDWMFINDYFHYYLGYNPFGHSALDIKALYMGMKRVPWRSTSFRYVSANELDNRELKHNALEDAIDQGMIFSKLLGELTSG